MIDYHYTNIMIPKAVHKQLTALQSEVGVSKDTLITMAVTGLLKQLEDKTTKEKRAALGIK